MLVGRYVRMILGLMKMKTKYFSFSKVFSGESGLR